MSLFITLLTIFMVIICVLIILLVLMQRPKQEGLGAAFGGGMTDQMFGAQTTNVLQKATVWLAIGFFVISLALSILMSRQGRKDDGKGEGLLNAPAVTAPAAPAPGSDADILNAIKEAGIDPEGLTLDPEAAAAVGATPEAPAPAPGEPAPVPAEGGAEGTPAPAPAPDAPTQPEPTTDAPALTPEGAEPTPAPGPALPPAPAP